MSGRFLLLVAIATAMLTSCSPDSGTAGADRGNLVVTGADGSVALVDPDGGESQTLSASGGSGVAVQATPSHEGDTVVWTEVVDGKPMVAVYDGSEVEHIEAATAPFFYMFSPDDTLVAALGNDPGGGGVALVMVDPTAASAEVVDVGQPYFVSWNTDSAELAAHIGSDVIARVGLDGTRTPIAALPGPYQAPQWLPDGRLVGVVLTEGTTAGVGDPVTLQTSRPSLAILDPDSGQLDRLIDVDSAVTFEATTDGERIALVDGVGPGGLTLGTLEVVSVAGDEPVTVAEEGVVAFEWSPDGRALLYHTLDREEGLVPHVWDGNSVRDHSGFVPTGVLLEQYLPFWSQYVQTITQWSPDGSTFVYAAISDDGEGTIWVQPIDGDRRQVAAGEMAVWSR